MLNAHCNAHPVRIVRSDLGQVIELEAALTAAMLEQAPDGPGPCPRTLHRELDALSITAAVLIVGCVGAILIVRPPSSTLLAVAAISLAYACSSPVLVAALLRHRDETDAHGWAHEQVEAMRGNVSR
ncbi:MAG: hypothetical protein IPJ41_07705 [Phycisphaerales bacterium]|nr:hypothetical protein [Phycisphaerales bacterium]